MLNFLCIKRNDFGSCRAVPFQRSASADSDSTKPFWATSTEVLRSPWCCDCERCEVDENCAQALRYIISIN